MGALDVPIFGDVMLDIVIGVAFMYHMLLMYMKVGLHLRMSEVKLPRIQQVLFSLLFGSLAFFGDFFKLVLAERTGLVELTPLFSSLPGVLITFTIWVYFVRLLKFRPLHAFEISVYTYLFFQTITGVTRLISAVFFAQPPGTIDYQRYLLMYAVNFAVSVAFFLWMRLILVRRPNLLIVKGMSSATREKSIAFAIFQLCFIYLSAALIMILIPKTIIGSTVSLIMLALFSAFSIALNSNRYQKAEIFNKEKQLQSLFESLNQFGAIKHDFYNILQTYNGYFAIGDLEACKRYHQSLVEMTIATGNLLDIGRHAVEHPALVSLLINKHERAAGMQTRLDIAIRCPLSDLPIQDIDICRIAACLLDNAIEAAAVSKEKSVSFTIERDENHVRRIVVANSSVGAIDISNVLTPGFTSKKGHQGIGLVNVQKIVERYPHCTLQMRGAEGEVVATLILGSAPPEGTHQAARRSSDDLTVVSAR